MANAYRCLNMYHGLMLGSFSECKRHLPRSVRVFRCNMSRHLITSFQIQLESPSLVYCWSLGKWALCVCGTLQDTLHNILLKSRSSSFDTVLTPWRHTPESHQWLIGQQSPCATKHSNTQITSYLIVRQGETVARGIKRYSAGFGSTPVFLIRDRIQRNTQECC